MKEKVNMLMILDGFGDNPNQDGNAIKLAKTPNIDRLMKKYPNTDIYASGPHVGLPEGQMGNSEVGHTNIGAGRIVYQELTRITKSIEEGDFFSIPEFIAAIDNCKKHNSKLHILGLVSDGGVHSHIRHLYGLLEMAKRRDFEDVYVHCFLDGRDTPPASGESYILKLQDKMKEKGIGKIATISGRFYAMDRDKRWQRIEMLQCNGKRRRKQSKFSNKSNRRFIPKRSIRRICRTNSNMQWRKSNCKNRRKRLSNIFQLQTRQSKRNNKSHSRQRF